ncbi:alpha-protein kinase 1-like [Gigantopelta aegis]|uniref:alpha-protein kinase 1-like n=1 Tax=Gigantopelta aegis TaxID=1735272 RepID=UPI001B8875C1|nr:alpha-protein kinase 1-like [Gigantopelta aegis]
MFLVRNKTSDGSFSSKNDEVYHANFSTLPCKKGVRKNVYNGVLRGTGDKKGDKVLVKAFKSKETTEELCTKELERYKQAKSLGRTFNKLVPSPSNKVEFNVLLAVPVEKVAFTNCVRRSKNKVTAKEWVIIEENLGMDFKDFIQKDGTSVLIDPTSLDAFVHYSYHKSGGKLVIVGLRGVESETDNGYKLTCPVIHSYAQTFGDTDRGEEGIRKAFEHHRCTNMCYAMDRPQVKLSDNLKANET